MTRSRLLRTTAGLRPVSRVALSVSGEVLVGSHLQAYTGDRLHQEEHGNGIADAGRRVVAVNGFQVQAGRGVFVHALNDSRRTRCDA